MTIYQIKKLTEKTNPYFFTRGTMKFFGQTLKDFRVKKQSGGRYRISADSYRNEQNGFSINNKTIRYFNPINNELEIK